MYEMFFPGKSSINRHVAKFCLGALTRSQVSHGKVVCNFFMNFSFLVFTSYLRDLRCTNRLYISQIWEQNLLYNNKLLDQNVDKDFKCRLDEEDNTSSCHITPAHYMSC